MLSIRVTSSSRYPKALVTANSLAWSSEPKAFLKSMYKRTMSWFVNFAYSSAAIRLGVGIVWMCFFLL